MAGIGEAIGLSDKPNLYSGVLNSTLARQDAKEARAEEARRKAQEKNDAEAKKAVSIADVYMNPDKWHRMYAGAAAKEIVDFKNDFIDYKTKHPDSWSTYASMKGDELKARLGELMSSSNNAKALEKAALTGKAHVPSDFLEKANKTDFSAGLYRDPETGKIVSPAWEDLASGTDERYGVLFDKSGALNLDLVPKTDFGKQIEQFTNNDHNWTDKGIKIAPVKGAPNRYQQQVTQATDPVSSETFVNQITTTPAYVKDWMLSNMDKVDKEIDPSLRSDPPKYAAAVRELMANDVRKATTLQRNKITGFTDRPPQPSKEEKEKVNLDASLDDLMPHIAEHEQYFANTDFRNKQSDEVKKLREQAESLSADESKQKEGLLRQASIIENKLKSTQTRSDIEYKMPVKTKTESSYTTVNNGEGVIDLATNRQLSGVDQFNFKPKHIGILTVRGKKKAYVFGDTSNKEAAFDKDGNVESDKNVTKEIAVPIDKVEKFLNDQGNPTKWTKEAIERAENKKKSNTTEDKGSSLRKKYNY